MSNLKQSLPSSGPITEKHEVTTVRDAATGIVTYEQWFKDGKCCPDRADGPAYIMRDAATGFVTREEWFKDGKRDRADGPAYIKRDAATGTVTFETWCKDGKQVAPPSPVASEQDEILSLAAEFKTAVAAFGERAADCPSDP